MSECKLTINHVAIKLIVLVISEKSRGPLKTFPRATGWTPLDQLMRCFCQSMDHRGSLRKNVGPEPCAGC